MNRVMGYFVIAGLAFIGLFFVNQNVSASDDSKNSGTETVMETMVVTADRVAESQKKVAANVSVIDEEAISRSSARDVGDLLAQQGLAIRKYPGNLTSIAIRGFRTETHGNDLKGHVLVLLNGRRAGTGNVAKLLTQNVERIEIIRGPASVQYGSAAMGGVINIITKQGKGTATAFAQAGIGSWGYKEGSAGFAGEKGQFDFSGSFTLSSQDNYDTGKGITYQNTGVDSADNISLNLGWSFAPKNRIGLIYTGFDVDEAGSSGYLSQNDSDDYVDKSNNSIDAVYDGESNEGVCSWKFRYFNGRDKDKWTSPIASNPDGWDDGIPSENNTDNQGAQAQTSLKLGSSSRITAGLDWAEYDIETTWSPEKTDYANTAGFLLAKTELLNNRLTLTGGIRYDDYEVTVKEPAGNSENDSNVSPSIGVAFLPVDWLKLRATYGQAFVMPAADQLAADYQVWGSHYVGNPSLKPEKSDTFDGGFDVYAGYSTASLTVFTTDFEDKIQQKRLADGSNSWVNLGDASITGIETELNYDIGSALNWGMELLPYIQLTWLAEYEDGETGEDLLYTPDLTAAFGLRLTDRKNGLTANLSFTIIGEQTVEDWESTEYPTPEVTLDDSIVTDISISKELASFNHYGTMTLRGEIHNLFDEDYEYVKGYPMPGQGFFIGLRYDY